MTENENAHPVFEQHGSFVHMKLGRNPVKHDARTLQFARYFDDAVLPQIPTSHATPHVPSWPMYGNDRLGDCTCAAAGHMVQGWTEAVGALRTPLDADVEHFYIPVTGNQDDGRNEIDVLNAWRKLGFGGDKIGAYVSIDPTNVAHVKAAIYLFGGVYTGIALPLSAQGEREWKVATGAAGEPGSWGGHAVPYLGYTRSTFTCVTWGATLPLTVGFNDKYTEEVYAIISPDFLDAQGHSPQGFNLAALTADLANL